MLLNLIFTTRSCLSTMYERNTIVARSLHNRVACASANVEGGVVLCGGGGVGGGVLYDVVMWSAQGW